MVEVVNIILQPPQFSTLLLWCGDPYWEVGKNEVETPLPKTPSLPNSTQYLTWSLVLLVIKVRTFWEAQKNLFNLPHALYIYLVNLMKKIFSNFVCFLKSTNFKITLMILLEHTQPAYMTEYAREQILMTFFWKTWPFLDFPSCFKTEIFLTKKVFVRISMRNQNLLKPIVRQFVTVAKPIVSNFLCTKTNGKPH